MFCPVVSLEEVPALCLAQFRRGPLIIFVFMYMVQNNFVLVCKSLVIVEAMPKENKKKKKKKKRRRE